jgi:ATP/ADP translocase
MYSDSGLLAGGGKSAGNSDSALKLAVMVGAVQSILSKSAKCALFDPTLQMAYIPLDNESKVILAKLHTCAHY